MASLKLADDEFRTSIQKNGLKKAIQPYQNDPLLALLVWLPVGAGLFAWPLAFLFYGEPWFSLLFAGAVASISWGVLMLSTTLLTARIDPRYVGAVIYSQYWDLNIMGYVLYMSASAGT